MGEALGTASGVEVPGLRAQVTREAQDAGKMEGRSPGRLRARDGNGRSNLFHKKVTMNE